MRTGLDTIRDAEVGDAAGIADLVRFAFSAQPRPTIPPSGALKETAASIADHLARGGGAVVEREAVIVGVVLWSEEEGGLYLGRLAVHPQHRRRGLARILIGRAEDEARRRGLTWMHLGVRLELEDNRRLFRSCGFQETTLHCHEGFPEPTWLRMERRLQ